MENITIIEQDRVDAQNFLQQLMTDKVTDGDFRKGNALFDFAIGGLSAIFAYVKREVDYVKARQSLLLLASLIGDTDTARAVDEILSNWFLTRNTGRNSRGTVTIHLSDNDSFTVPTSMRFYRADGTAFQPDYTSDQAFGTSDMDAVVDASGVVTSYALRVQVVAVETGDNDIEPGAFTDYSPRVSRVQRIENDNTFSGGTGEETTEEFLDRAETAVSTRNMASGRSIDATLRDAFSAIEDIVVIGHGDAEMVRDLLDETVTSIRLHLGGHSDAFIRSAINESQEFTGEIGGVFSDPRPGFNVFRDDTLDFATAGVLRGHVIAITNGLLTEPQNYIVEAVNEYMLLVSRRAQFPDELPEVEEAHIDGEVGPTIGGAHPLAAARMYGGTEYTFETTDIGKFIRVKNSSASNDGVWEIIDINDAPGDGINYATLGGLTVPSFSDESNVQWDLCTRSVHYTIGDAPPSYDNVVAERSTGLFTQLVQTDGRILLPTHPLYKIRDVSFEDSANVTGYAVGGRVTFPTRVNVTPADPSGNPDNLEYQVTCGNYPEAQSGWHLMELVVGWAGAEDVFNGYNLRVTYDTILSFDDIWAFMVDPERRQVCASTIPRGKHPVYLSCTVSYKLVRTAVEELDESAAALALANYVNTFPTTEELDISDFVSLLRLTYDVLGQVVIPTVPYTLYAPDGRLIGFETSDIVEIVALKETGVVASDRLEDPISQGVSVNTIRYILDAADVTFVQL